jgi:hypothetical protein
MTDEQEQDNISKVFDFAEQLARGLDLKRVKVQISVNPFDEDDWKVVVGPWREAQ